VNLSEQVRCFIGKFIPTLGHLEVLLLCRSQPTELWTAERVDAHLRTSVNWARERLESLRDHGLLEVDRRQPRAFRMAHLTQDTRSTVEMLAEEYRVRRVAVISEIYAVSRNSPGHEGGRGGCS
jgi:hypothetical protein